MSPPVQLSAVGELETLRRHSWSTALGACEKFGSKHRAARTRQKDFGERLGEALPGKGYLERGSVRIAALIKPRSCYGLGEETIEHDDFGPHGPDRLLLRILPDRVGILEHGLTFGRQVQAAATPSGGRIHHDMTQRQKALEVARQRRLFDIEIMTDLDSRDPSREAS